MKGIARSAWQILVVAVWINLSETVRWILYSRARFEDLYRSVGLALPQELANDILWLIWGIIMALLVFILSRKFTLLQTTVIAWLPSFVMTWIALWNFAILPLEILLVAGPLSLIEVFIAAVISKKLQQRRA